MSYKEGAMGHCEAYCTFNLGRLWDMYRESRTLECGLLGLDQNLKENTYEVGDALHHLHYLALNVAGALDIAYHCKDRKCLDDQPESEEAPGVDWKAKYETLRAEMLKLKPGLENVIALGAEIERIADRRGLSLVTE